VNGPIVVDVGNTRVKWGRTAGGRVVDVAALSADAEAWQRQFDLWRLGPNSSWIVSGVHPHRREALLAWLSEKAARVQVLDSYQQLPLSVEVEEPGKVGIDRLLNAVAANTQRRKESAAVIVDAGSAVTVDLVDAAGAFRGGAIFPGLQMMARALNDYTAALPLVDVDVPERPPGINTIHAIRVGILAAALGGIEQLVHAYRGQAAAEPEVYITGGDGTLLVVANPGLGGYWPAMTLVGILHSAGAVSSHG
jgi:type III pantothenate kinase